MIFVCLFFRKSCTTVYTVKHSNFLQELWLRNVDWRWVYTTSCLSFLSFNLHTARQLLKPQIHFHFNKVSAYQKFFFIIWFKWILYRAPHITHTENYSVNNRGEGYRCLKSTLSLTISKPNINCLSGKAGFPPLLIPISPGTRGEFLVTGSYTSSLTCVSLHLHSEPCWPWVGRLSQLSLSLPQVCRAGNRATERDDSGKARVNPVLILKSDIWH